MRKKLYTKHAASPKGAYNQGIISRGLYVHVSAQGAFDPETGNIEVKTFAEQVERTYANIDAILKAAGAGLENVVKVTVYIPDWIYLDELNAIHAITFKKPYPARTPVKMDVPFGLFMADAVAVIN